MSKLIAYFSASGVTAKAAKALASQIGADTYEIEASPVFTREDLDWTNKNSRCYKEMHDDACRPPLGQPVPDVSKYSDIIVAFPIWWGVEPRQVNTFLDGIDISGKRLTVFATSGGSPVGPSENHLKKLYPKGDWAGCVLANNGDPVSWAEKLGY